VGLRTTGYSRAAVEVATCSGPGLRTAVIFGAGVEEGGVLKEGRRQWSCSGLSECRDGNRWKFLEILLSVGREHVGPKILGYRHPM
jgi:hypothetical protein